MKVFSIICFVIFISMSSHAQTNYTWTGTHSNNWNDSLNWTPKGIPTTTDNISNNQATTTSAYIILDQNRTVNSCNIQNAYLDLKGYTLTINDSSSFNTVKTTPGSLNFAGNLNLNIFKTSANINAVCSSIIIINSQFDSTVYMQKTGNSASDTWASNIFSQTVTLIQNSPNNTWYLGGGNIGDIYQQDVTFNVQQGALYVSKGYSAFFRGNVNLVSTGGGITIGDSITTSSMPIIISSGKSIVANNFSSGKLILNNISQEGTASNSFQFTGTANLSINQCNFGGDVTINTTGTDTSNAAVQVSNSMFNQSTTIIAALANLTRNYFNASNSTASETKIIQVALGNLNELQVANTIVGNLITKQ